MSSGCMSSSSALGCIDGRGPVRATYRNLYKWPESDAEFVKSVSLGRSPGGGGGCEQRRRGSPRRRCHQYQQPRVVDSYSCRQMYLRSYTFSRKESVPERTRKCLGKVKERVAAVAVNGKKVPASFVPLCVSGGTVKEGSEKMGTASAGDSGGKIRKKARCPGARRLREVSTAAFCSIFYRLISCTASVDVADR